MTRAPTDDERRWIESARRVFADVAVTETGPSLLLHCRTPHDSAQRVLELEVALVPSILAEPIETLL